MMRKCIVLFAILLLLPIIGLSAQQTGSYTIFQTEVGMSMQPVTGAAPSGYLGLNYRFSPGFSVGVISFNSYALIAGYVALKYDVIPQLRFVGGIGWDGDALLGFELIPIRQALGSGTLEFKLLFDGAINQNLAQTYFGGFVLAYGL
jgi:hypothetical protein